MDDYRQHFSHAPLFPLAAFPGFSVQQSICLDWMHNSSLGIGQVAAGSALAELCADGTFGVWVGNRKAVSRVRLKRAWHLFCNFCVTDKLQHSQQTFTPNSLSMSYAADDEWPLLKSKAHNCMLVLRWLASLLCRENNDRQKRQMARVFWALAECDHIFSRGPCWLNENQVESLKLVRATLFPSWRALAAHACKQGRARWKFVPKHHLIEHQL